MLRRIASTVALLLVISSFTTVLVIAGDQPSAIQADQIAVQSVDMATAMPAPPLAGGLFPASSTDQGVQAAAEFAAKEISARSNSAQPMTLSKVLEVKRQVVAGMNYFVKIELKTPSGNAQVYNAVVYQNLQQQLSLTSFSAA